MLLQAQSCWQLSERSFRKESTSLTSWLELSSWSECPFPILRVQNWQSVWGEPTFSLICLEYQEVTYDLYLPSYRYVRELAKKDPTSKSNVDPVSCFPGIVKLSSLALTWICLDFLFRETSSTSTSAWKQSINPSVSLERKLALSTRLQFWSTSFYLPLFSFSGRAIRHQNDYVSLASSVSELGLLTDSTLSIFWQAALILLDRRYSRPDIKGRLPGCKSEALIRVQC